jgi:hypothetical protein
VGEGCEWYVCASGQVGVEVLALESQRVLLVLQGARVEMVTYAHPCAHCGCSQSGLRCPSQGIVCLHSELCRRAGAGLMQGAACQCVCMTWVVCDRVLTLCLQV